MAKIVIDNLSKYFGELKALDRVSLVLEAGQSLALLGANGAGKSTLLNCIAGISMPQKGRIDFPPNTRIGYLAHKSFLYDEMNIRANLHFWGRLSQVSNYKTRADELIEKSGLKLRALDKIRSLSAGLQKRAALCRAVINRPDILLLDEPYSAFDSDGAAFLGKMVEETKQAGGIVIIATHFIEQALKDCSHAAVLHKGKLETFADIDQVNAESLRNRVAPIGGAA